MLSFLTDTREKQGQDRSPLPTVVMNGESHRGIWVSGLALASAPACILASERM